MHLRAFKCKTLAKLSSDFKEIKDDPKNKSQAIVYMTGGSLAVLYATGINYPIDCLREFRKSYDKFFTGRVFGYVGFPTSMGNIIPHLSPPKNSFHKWSQTHFLIQMPHFNGILTSYPYQFIRYNVSFIPYVKNYLKSVGRKMISSYLSSHFKREISGIPFMAV